MLDLDDARCSPPLPSPGKLYLILDAMARGRCRAACARAPKKNIYIARRRSRHVDKAFLPFCRANTEHQLFGSAFWPPKNGLVVRLRLAPAARAHRHIALHVSAAAGRALGGRRRPSAGASRGGRYPQEEEGAGARRGAGRGAVEGAAAAGPGARGRGRHVPAAGAVQPGLRLLPRHPQGHPRAPRRQCGAVRVHPAADVEADARGQHPVRELLPAQVRGAVGGGEVRGREAGQGAGGGVAAHPPHQQAQRHHPGHRQPREADRLARPFRHRQHLRLRRARRHHRRERRRPDLLQLRVGDTVGADGFAQPGQGHRQGEHGGAVRRQRQRQAVAGVAEGSESHSGLVSSMSGLATSAFLS